MASNNHNLYEKWIDFIGKYNFKLPSGKVGEILEKTLKLEDGLSFLSAYRKISGDIFGESSNIRLRLMILTCYRMNFFNDRYKRDLEEYINSFETPNEKTRMFFEKYCVIPRRLESGDRFSLCAEILNMKIDIQKEEFVIKMPHFIVAFLSFLDEDQYSTVLSPQNQVLFDIISNHDIKGDSTFVDVDLAIEGSKLNDEIVKYFLKLRRLKDKIHPTDQKDIFTSIADYATNARYSLLINIMNDEKVNIKESSPRLFSSLNRVGKYFKEETGELNEKEQKLVELFKKRNEMQKEVLPDELKALVNPIESMYNVLCNNIETTILEAVSLFIKVDKEGALAFLFCIYVGIDSICDWWTIYEGTTRSLKSWLQFIDKEKQELAQETASLLQ